MKLKANFEDSTPSFSTCPSPAALLLHAFLLAIRTISSQHLSSFLGIPLPDSVQWFRAMMNGSLPDAIARASFDIPGHLPVSDNDSLPNVKWCMGHVGPETYWWRKAKISCVYILKFAINQTRAMIPCNDEWISQNQDRARGATFFSLDHSLSCFIR